MREPAPRPATPPGMRSMAWLAGVAVIVLVAGCTATAPSAGPARSGPPAVASPTVAASTNPGPTTAAGGTVDCDHSIATPDTPSPGTRVALDAVALPGSVLTPVRDRDGWLWAKHGLEVRVGAVVEIAVAPEAAGHARIGWGSPGRPADRHVIDGCSVPGCAADCGWLAFAGGYWVDAPRCVPLVIRSGGRVERLGVGVGATCGD